MFVDTNILHARTRGIIEFQNPVVVFFQLYLVDCCHPRAALFRPDRASSL